MISARPVISARALSAAYTAVAANASCYRFDGEVRQSRTRIHRQRASQAPEVLIPLALRWAISREPFDESVPSRASAHHAPRTACSPNARPQDLTAPAAGEAI